MKNSIRKFRSINETIWKEIILTQILFSQKTSFMFNVEQTVTFTIAISSKEKKKNGRFRLRIGSRIDYKIQIEIDRSYLLLESIIFFIDEDISMVLKYVCSIFGTTQTGLC